MRRYQAQLAEDDAVDFDDLLMRAVFLFEQHPEILTRYQERWQQILVDEYQDTNRAQYLICRHAGGEAPQPRRGRRRRPEHLLAGAARTCGNILDFERDYPDATGREARAELPLDADDPRRGPRGRQPQRRPQGQELWTDRGAGAAITLFDAYNEYEEAEFVARQVEKPSAAAAAPR